MSTEAKARMFHRWRAEKGARAGRRIESCSESGGAARRGGGPLMAKCGRGAVIVFEKTSPREIAAARRRAGQLGRTRVMARAEDNAVWIVHSLRAGFAGRASRPRHPPARRARPTTAPDIRNRLSFAMRPHRWHQQPVSAPRAPQWRAVCSRMRQTQIPEFAYIPPPGSAALHYSVYSTGSTVRAVDDPVALHKVPFQPIFIGTEKGVNKLFHRTQYAP